MQARFLASFLSPTSFPQEAAEYHNGHLTPAKLTDDEEQEALAILKDPHLLDIVLDHVHRCRVVGEETNILLAWLVCMSRKIERPLGMCIRSRSGAGASCLLEAVGAFVPEEDKLGYAALTPQALGLLLEEQRLAHKALFITDASRQLLNKIKSIRAPAALLLCSVSHWIDEETLTHLLVLGMDESPEQTRRIHEAQQRAQTMAGIIEKRGRSHWIRLQQNIQRLIRPLVVHNPFAQTLGFKSGQLRARCDQQKYLDLIDVIALVHQHQRPLHNAVDREGLGFDYIEVSREDIERAEPLLSPVFQRTADELSPPARRLWTQLQALNQEKPQNKWNRRQIRGRFGWSDTHLRRALRQLVELEYVIELGGGQGRRGLHQLAANTGREETDRLTSPNFAPTSPCINGEVVKTLTNSRPITLESSSELRQL